VWLPWRKTTGFFPWDPSSCLLSHENTLCNSYGNNSYRIGSYESNIIQIKNSRGTKSYKIPLKILQIKGGPNVGLTEMDNYVILVVLFFLWESLAGELCMKFYTKVERNRHITDASCTTFVVKGFALLVHWPSADKRWWPLRWGMLPSTFGYARPCMHAAAALLWWDALLLSFACSAHTMHQ
jgi:hypothetical protein